MSVDAVVYYRVSNATVSVANVENAHHSTRLLAQTTLRNILGTKNLHEILSDRESISSSMQASVRSRFVDEGRDREEDTPKVKRYIPFVTATKEPTEMIRSWK